MKPFDKEAALRGEKVVTRDGREVVMLTYNPEAGERCQLVGWVNGAVWWWDDLGRISPLYTSDNDLFMAPKKRTIYVNVYKGHLYTAYESKTEAMRRGEADATAIAVPCEIEY